MNGLMFVLGAATSAILLYGMLYWWAFRKRSEVFIVDRWWLENEERWNGLRQAELGNDEDPNKGGPMTGRTRWGRRST